MLNTNNFKVITSILVLAAVSITQTGCLDVSDDTDDSLTTSELSSSIDESADFIKIENNANELRCKATLDGYKENYLNMKAIYVTETKLCRDYNRTSTAFGVCHDEYLPLSYDGTCVYSYDFDLSRLDSSIDLNADNVMYYQGVNAGQCIKQLELTRGIYPSAKGELRAGLVTCQDLAVSGSCSTNMYSTPDLNQTCLVSYNR